MVRTCKDDADASEGYIAEEAKVASERALLQAARLKEKQQKTTAQVSQVIGAQAQEA